MLSARSRLAAFRSSSGEYAWSQNNVARALEDLRRANLAILGGEAWLVVGSSISGLIPCRRGHQTVFHWECDRQRGESWPTFVDRSSAEAAAAVIGLRVEEEALLPEGGVIVYNVTWVAEGE